MEHLFNADFLRATPQQQHGKAADAAGFAYEDVVLDVEEDCYAAALKAPAAWAAEGVPLMDDAQQLQHGRTADGKPGRNQGKGRRGGKGSAQATGPGGRKVPAAAGGGRSRKSHGRGAKGSRGGGRSKRAGGGRAAGKGVAAVGKRQRAGSKAATAAAGGGDDEHMSCAGGYLQGGAKGKRQRREPWEMSDGDDDLSG